VSAPFEETSLYCPRCGYNLTGLTRSRCPECGTQFTIITDAERDEAGVPSSGKGLTFVKGGALALGGFLVLGLACVVIGGRVRIDICGALALFAIGGFIALGLRAIYGRGYREGRQKAVHPGEDQGRHMRTPPPRA
jgi:hypothetical protein